MKCLNLIFVVTMMLLLPGCVKNKVTGIPTIDLKNIYST